MSEHSLSSPVHVNARTTRPFAFPHLSFFIPSSFLYIGPLVRSLLMDLQHFHSRDRWMEGACNDLYARYEATPCGLGAREGHRRSSFVNTTVQVGSPSRAWAYLPSSTPRRARATDGSSEDEILVSRRRRGASAFGVDEGRSGWAAAPPPCSRRGVNSSDTRLLTYRVGTTGSCSRAETLRPLPPPPHLPT